MRSAKAVGRVLWTLQVLLGLFFVVASGAPKLFMPPELLADAMPIPLSRPFLLFIGVCEVLGGLGLILPGLLRVRPGLTPLAAAGLTLLTACATVYQLLARQPESAVFAAGMGLVCAAVAYGRWRLVPLTGASRARGPLLQPAA